VTVTVLVIVIVTAGVSAPATAIAVVVVLGGWMESKIILPYRLLLASAPALESLCLAAFPRVVRLVAEHALSGKDFFSVKTLF
jgi:hypothetical protein